VWTAPVRRSRRPSARCRRCRLYIRSRPALYSVLYTANDDRDRYALARHTIHVLYTHNQVTAPRRRGPPRFSNTVLETFLRRRFYPQRLSFPSTSLSSVDRFKEYNIEHDDHHWDNVRNGHPQVGTRTRSSTPLVQSADGPRSGLRVFGQRKEDERPEETRWHADRLQQKHLRQVLVVLRRIEEFAGLQVSIHIII